MLVCIPVNSAGFIITYHVIVMSLSCSSDVFALHLFVSLPLFYLVALQLLRKCILNMTIPCVVPDGPLGVPPFEKPSIAKVILSVLN